MGFDVRLLEPGTKETAQLPFEHVMTGNNYRAIYDSETGKFAPMPIRDAELGVTFNYSRWYRKPEVFPDYGEDKSGLEAINTMQAADSISILEHAIQEIESMEEYSPEETREFEKDGLTGYWTPTKANALKPLYQLLAMAKLRPDCIWEISG